jgi:WD40 repeat protein
VRVYCPALRTEDRPRTNAHDEDEVPQPTLVVLGSVRDRGEWQAEIEVEKVLYGSAPRRKFQAIKSLDYHPPEKPEHCILALAPTSEAWVDVDRERFRLEIRYSLSAEAEKAVAALSAARLDYNTLSAEIIFVGKELSADVDKGRSVEVVRVLHGPAALKGTKVCVHLAKYPVPEDRKPALAKEEMLYFVAAVEARRGKRSFGPVRKPDGPVYLTYYRLPADQEKNVREALNRRDRYPVVEIGEGDEKVKVREVLFQGTIPQAVALIDSESEGAAVLAGRFLIHHRKEARGPIVDAIDQDLLRTKRQHGFERLQHLISLLPQVLPEETRQEEGDRLVEKWLAHLAKDPPAPPAGAFEQWPTYRFHEEHNTANNHSLAWLLGQMDEERVVRRYGKRLLALREKVPAGWKREVQLALDVGNVEDHLELADVLPRLKDARPVRSRAAMRHPGGDSDGVLAFSPDGKFLATAGGGGVKYQAKADIRVWKTADWSPACKPIPQQNSTQKLLFSPDGQYLYVLGDGAEPYLHARYDWRSGKLDRTYEGPKKAGMFDDMELSADGKVMVTSNTSEDVIYVRETETGKALKTLATGDTVAHFALSPDGKTLIWQKARVRDEEEKTDWIVEALGPGALKIPAAVFHDVPSWLHFTPDGRYLLGLVERGEEEKRETRLHVWDVRRGFRETARAPVGGRWDRIGVVPNGQFVVVIDDRRKEVLLDEDARIVDARTFSLPDLKPLKQFVVPEKEEENDMGAIRFSPDGKLLAVGFKHRPTPLLLRTDTYAEVIPFEGHGRNITGVFFPPGDKVVRTLAADNTICTWDARTLKLLRRQILPPGWKQQSAREPDGRYLIGGAGKRSLAVFDVEADAVVTTVKVPHDLSSPVPILWANGREVYAMGHHRLRHFDVTCGKVLARRKFKTSPGPGAVLTEDGKDFLAVGGDVESPVIELERVSMRTGKAARVGEIRWRRFAASQRGVVPGGKFFYIADPGFYLFDTKSMKLVASRAFRGADVLRLAFTRDGSRFAVVTGGRIHVDLGPGLQLKEWDPETQTVVRIHDTRTGRTLGAFPASMRWASVKFAPDGRRLAVINNDGTFELWDLSPLERP